MADTSGVTNRSKTNVVITETDGSIKSFSNNYLKCSELATTSFILEDATLCNGKIIYIDNDSGGSVDFTGYSSQTINGNSSFNLHSDNSITIISNAANWRIIASYIF